MHARLTPEQWSSGILTTLESVNRLRLQIGRDEEATQAPGICTRRMDKEIWIYFVRNFSDDQTTILLWDDPREVTIAQEWSSYSTILRCQCQKHKVLLTMSHEASAVLLTLVLLAKLSGKSDRKIRSPRKKIKSPTKFDFLNAFGLMKILLSVSMCLGKFKISLICTELERIRGEKQFFKKFSSFLALSVISQNSAATLFGCARFYSTLVSYVG